MAIMELKYLAPFLYMFGLSLAELRTCFSFEEGKPVYDYFSCDTTDNFVTQSARPKIGNTVEYVGHCDFDGMCTNSDTSRFISNFFLDSNGYRSVFLDIVSHSRDITEMHCYEDGLEAPLERSCSTGAFVLPSTPVCSPPVFDSTGQSAEVTCVSDRIFPSATCGIQLKDGSPSISTAVTWTSNIDDPSPNFPDDKQLTCTYTYNVQSEDDGDYSYQAVLTPVNSRNRVWPPDVKTVTDLPVLQLRAPVLTDSADNDQELGIPNGGDLTVAIPVTANPDPSLDKLVYSSDGTSVPEVVSTSDYTATFTRTPGTLDGVMTLKIRKTFSRNGPPSLFTVQMTNGVVGPAFSFRFTVAPTSAISDDFCQGKSLGFYEHPGSCDDYVRCLGYPWRMNRPVVMPCPLGTRWDQSLLTCNHKYAVSCS